MSLSLFFRRCRVSSLPRPLPALTGLSQLPRQYSSSLNPPFDPLNPSIETNELGLPISPSPIPSSILSPPPSLLSKSTLRKLHKLSAIAPPIPDSPQEEQLRQSLGGLIGLMDQVKGMKLEFEDGDEKVTKENIRMELSQGIYADPEDIFDGRRIDEEGVDYMGMDATEEKGRDLLKFSEASQGVYYVFETKKRQGSEDS